MAVDICNSPDWCFFLVVFFVQRKKCVNARSLYNRFFLKFWFFVFLQRLPKDRLDRDVVAMTDLFMKTPWRSSDITSTEVNSTCIYILLWKQLSITSIGYNRRPPVYESNIYMPSADLTFQKRWRDFLEKMNYVLLFWNEYLIQKRFQIASAPGIRQRLVALIGFGEVKTNRISAFF